MRGLLTATVLLAAFFTTLSASACDLAHAPTTRWTIARHGAVSNLVTPCGDPFFSTGVNVLDAGITASYLDRPHYDWRNSAGSLDEWVAETKERLARWGFNSAGAWSLPPRQLKLPAVINLELGRLARFHWFDPFDPAAKARMFAEAKTLTAPYRDSPYRIGYFADNEVGWWDGALFLFYAAKPATSFTKQHLVAMLRSYYHGDWRRFARDFVPPPGVGSWPALLRTETPTKLRAGGRGMLAVERWTGEVAAQYYKVARAALKAADPNALFFGDRLPIYYDQQAIRAEAPYVDAIAVNYNVDSPEGWLAPYFFDGLRHLTGGKPVLISEWFYAARENRTGNRNNGHLMTVETQAERAAGAAASAKLFAGIPEIVGLHWFQYYDYPVGGRADSEDYNFGLVDIRNQPYEKLVTALGAANRQLPALHARAGAIARPSLKDFAVPYATIDPQHLSLIDWPKPASLLPPLKPEPGSVAFGEAYLTWSANGLALATIGQDYDDLDLLDYGAAYPLSEAYRVELDVDAGAGPKRFTLYFIPPKGATRDYPPMAPKLCAGSVAAVKHNDCAAIPGAQALYFGADQPRIVAEALLPWPALGIAGPPQAGKLRVEVSVVSWDNGRWMSLSGLPPRQDSANPKRWKTVPLEAE
ncbi:MAG TPA: hypothetical protein VNF99_15130 [Stellaceae bacterium]|nr:hypothetical protein [Stellaceae bacterium]